MHKHKTRQNINLSTMRRGRIVRWDCSWKDMLTVLSLCDTYAGGVHCSSFTAMLQSFLYLSCTQTWWCHDILVQMFIKEDPHSHTYTLAHTHIHPVWKWDIECTSELHQITIYPVSDTLGKQVHYLVNRLYVILPGNVILGCKQCRLITMIYIHIYIYIYV